MDNNTCINQLKEFISNKNYEGAKLLLDEMHQSQSRFLSSNRKVREEIIEHSLKEHSIEGLKLSQHIFCHACSENELSNIKLFISDCLTDESLHDLIIPCVLGSFINMEYITSTIISYQDRNLAYYVQSQPYLEFDYRTLALMLPQLFMRQEDIELVRLIDKNFSYNVKQIKECMDMSFKFNCIEGIEYLIQREQNLTMKLLSQWNSEISENETVNDSSFLTQVQFDEKTPAFLSQTLELLRKHFPINNEEQRLKSFLFSFIIHYNDVSLEQLFDFLDKNVSEKLLPNMIAFIKNEDVFDNLDSFYEKRELDKIIEVNLRTNKIKL